jgi:hypothetical protein
MLWLMFHYNNFSHGCILYLAIHGSYGFFWLWKVKIKRNLKKNKKKIYLI